MKIRLAAVLVLVASTFGVTLSASADQHEHQYYPWATEEFEAVWERTDRPVLEDVVNRTWIWGPGANHPDLITEFYLEAEDNERLVQYGDKSRMEWPWSPEADPESPWFITQGLLATELMTGRLQLGEDTFQQHLPSNRPAAGDPDDISGPTYRAMGMHIDRPPRAGGEVITEVIDRDGFIVEDEGYAQHEVIDVAVQEAQQIEGIDKNIASVFWDHMQSQTTIYLDGEYVQDNLYVNPFYAIGYPKTDAFWAEVKVRGVVTSVLVQCFERRCLTFQPDNPEGWEVESGNIGQHYYNWRYDEINIDEPVVPNEGHFLFEDSSAVTIGLNETITLTAHVAADGVGLRHVEVQYVVVEGDEHVSLGVDSSITNSYGNAFVNVTAESEGTAVVFAFVDLTGTGVYDADDDLGLGSVAVTVGEEVVEPGIDGTFTFDGQLDAEVGVGANVDLTAHVTENGADLEGAVVRFEAIAGAEFVTLVNAEATTDLQGEAVVTVTGDVAGEATINAWVDVENTGTFDVGTDVDLGDVSVTVVAIPDGGSFLINGDATTSFVVGGSATATAHVTLGGEAYQGAEVTFEITEGAAYVNLSATTATTDAVGNAPVTITGVAAGSATIHAFVDLDGTGTFNAATDLSLGEVTVNAVYA